MGTELLLNGEIRRMAKAKYVRSLHCAKGRFCPSLRSSFHSSSLMGIFTVLAREATAR